MQPKIKKNLHLKYTPAIQKMKEHIEIR